LQFFHQLSGHMTIGRIKSSLAATLADYNENRLSSLALTKNATRAV
jgi:hypothetical protein